jgi:hypothetical protein
MNPGFTLRSALAIFGLYAFVTILFLDGKVPEQAGHPASLVESSTRQPAPFPLPARY